MKQVELICIGCPLGCALTVQMDGSQVLSVTGNTCKNGDAYARKELTNPTRILTTTVPVTGGTLAVVSVKTAADVPKRLLLACVQALKTVTVAAPVHSGQVIVADLAGTGVPVIATKDVPRR